MGTKKYQNKVCEACGGTYKAKREWSKYCEPSCGKRVIVIYNQLLADIRTPLKEAAKKLAQLQLGNDNES